VNERVHDTADLVRTPEQDSIDTRQRIAGDLSYAPSVQPILKRSPVVGQAYDFNAFQIQ
jgi:hypothetical protein